MLFRSGDALVNEAAGLAREQAAPAQMRRLLQGSEMERMEGIRQLTKTWTKNLGLPRLEAMVAAGTAPGAQVPQQLQETMQIMEQVGKPVGGNGRIFTVVDAEHVLQSMGMGPRPLDAAAERLGFFVEGLQKLRPSTS